MENMSLNSQFYFLKNAMKILLPVSVFSLMFSQSYLLLPFLNSFNEFSSYISIQLFTYSSERNYIFLLCNGILVFIIKNSGLISTTNISDNHHHYPKESKIQETKIEFLEKVVEIGKQEKEEEIETMNQDDLVSVETIDENEGYQEPEDSRPFLQNNQLGYHYARYVEVIEELEEFEEEEETLEELHKKCDDFIKRIKKEINGKN